MRRALLDTDTISFYLKRHPSVVARVEEYLQEYGGLDFSVVTHYEIRRGLLHVNACEKLTRFEALADNGNVWVVDRRAAEVAADICTDLWKRGEPLDDSDILIASIARSNGLVLVTNNEAHYSRISGLQTENWLTN